MQKRQGHRIRCKPCLMALEDRDLLSGLIQGFPDAQQDPGSYSIPVFIGSLQQRSTDATSPPADFGMTHLPGEWGGSPSPFVSPQSGPTSYSEPGFPIPGGPPTSWDIGAPPSPGGSNPRGLVIIEFTMPTDPSNAGAWFVPGNNQVHASVWSKSDPNPEVADPFFAAPSPTDRTGSVSSPRNSSVSESSTLDLSAMKFGGPTAFAGVPSSSSGNSSNTPPSVAPFLVTAVNGSVVVLPSRATAPDITTNVHASFGLTFALPRLGTPVTDHSIVAQMSPTSTSDLKVVPHLFELSTASGVASLQTILGEPTSSPSLAPQNNQDLPVAGSNDSLVDLGSQPSPLPLTHAGGFLNDLVIDDESMYDHSLTEFLNQLPSLTDSLDQDPRFFQKATLIVAGALIGVAGYRRWRNQRQSFEIRSFFKESSSTLHGFS